MPKPYADAKIDDFPIVMAILKMHTVGFNGYQIAEYLEDKGLKPDYGRDGKNPARKEQREEGHKEFRYDPEERSRRSRVRGMQFNVRRIIKSHKSKIDRYREKFVEKAISDGFATLEFRIDMLNQAILEVLPKIHDLDQYGKPAWFPMFLQAIKTMGALQGDMGLNVNLRIDPKVLALSERMAMAQVDPKALPDTEGAKMPAGLQDLLDSVESLGEDVIEGELVDAEVAASSES